MYMLSRVLHALPKPKRRLLLLRTAGALRSLDEVRDFAREAAAARFDLYICARRGKSETDVPTLLRDTLLEQGIPEPSVLVIPESTEAIDAMLEMAKPGDLLVMLGGKRTGMIIDRLHERAATGGARMAIES
jgi:UDP-N-acetylmuramyl tripeptide synthase